MKKLLGLMALALVGCTDTYEVRMGSMANKTPYYICTKSEGFPLIETTDMDFCSTMEECNRICREYRVAQ